LIIAGDLLDKNKSDLCTWLDGWWWCTIEV